MNLIHIIECYYWIWIQSAIDNERCLWLWGSNANVNYGKIYSGRGHTNCDMQFMVVIFFIPQYFWGDFRKFIVVEDQNTTMTIFVVVIIFSKKYCSKLGWKHLWPQNYHDKCFDNPMSLLFTKLKHWKGTHDNFVVHIGHVWPPKLS